MLYSTQQSNVIGQASTNQIHRVPVQLFTESQQIHHFRWKIDSHWTTAAHIAEA